MSDNFKDPDIACSVCERDGHLETGPAFWVYSFRQLMTISPLVCTKLMHRPTTLRCGHTFCAGCLTRSSDGDRALCATCNGETDTTDRLPIDYAVNDLCFMPPNDRIAAAAAVKCAICLTSLMREPKTLVCGHTFCSDCVDRISHDRRVQCTTTLHASGKSLGFCPIRQSTWGPAEWAQMILVSNIFSGSDLHSKSAFRNQKRTFWAQKLLIKRTYFSPISEKKMFLPVAVSRK